MNVWKHSKNSGFRLTPPPDAERAEWVEVEAEKLEAPERVALKIDTLNESFTNKLAEMERRVDSLNAKLLDAGGPGVENGAVRQISLCKLFRGIAMKDWTGAEFERDVVNSPKARALAASTDAAGGYLVPSEYLADQFIPLLRANTFLDKVGARWLMNLKGSPVAMPKQSSGATAYWVDESSLITDSTQGTGQVVLTPRKLACLTKVSNELIVQADPSADAFVREDIARVMALKLDDAVVDGTGSSNEPLGIKGYSGVNTSSATAGTINTLWDMIALCEVDEIDSSDPSCAFIAHPTAWNIVRKAASAAGYPKNYAGAGYVIPDAAVGYPCYKSSQLGANEVIFGKWNDLIVAQWAGFQFRVSQDAGDAFAYDQTWMRATMLVDIGVRHAQSFCYNTVFGT